MNYKESGNEFSQLFLHLVVSQRCMNLRHITFSVKSYVDSEKVVKCVAVTFVGTSSAFHCKNRGKPRNIPARVDC
jgi:hypothetical protein